MLGDLVRRLEDAGLDGSTFARMPLKSLSRMSVTSMYPIDATPPSELIDPADAELAIGTACAVIYTLEVLDQASS